MANINQHKSGEPKISDRVDPHGQQIVNQLEDCVALPETPEESTRRILALICDAEARGVTLILDESGSVMGEAKKLQ